MSRSASLDDLELHVHVHFRMPDQRNSLPDRLGPDEAVAVRRAVLIGGNGEDEDWHGARMREGWLTGA